MRPQAPLLALAGLAALAFGLASGSAWAQGATLYRWVDEQGVVHFSDRPMPGAEKVEVPPAQSIPAPRVPAPRRAPAPEEPQGPVYSRVAIVQPVPEQSFVNTGFAPVEVAAAIEPRLQPGHQLWFYLDGQRLENVPTQARSTTVEVGRGTHTVAVRVVDQNGRELVTSEPVTFYVRQTSIQQPPRGPLPVPLPRPGG
jgi:hypothetical protein